MAIRKNTILYSWGSNIFTVDSEPLNGFRGVTWGGKRERPPILGSSRDGTPLGKPRGKTTVDEVKLTVLSDTAQQIREYLAAKAGGHSYGDAEFVFQVQQVEGDDVTTVLFEGCTYDSESQGSQESADGTETEITVGCLRMKINGLFLHPDEGAV